MTWRHLLVFGLVGAVACGRGPKTESEPGTVAGLKKGAPTIDTGPPPRYKIVALGDSITAGLGLLQVESYPGVIQQKLDNEGYEWEVVNAGASGDTSATARRRVDWVLEPNARILIIALGGNDALRGLSPKATHDNIAAIIEAARAKNVEVLVAGMQAPPNLGQDYTSAFRDAFAVLPREYPTIAFVPFLLEGVAGDPSLNQPDGIHPTAAGQQIIANLLYDKLKPLVDNISSRGGGQPHE
jgi:acyl-CoA thioesterase-1